ncbi:MAG: hypothetical protein WAM14_18870 [Candidatus Nitrosopolaris sp.]
MKKYETLDEMINAIDTAIEDKEEQIKNTKENQQQKKLKEEIKSLQKRRSLSPQNR